MKKRTQSRRAGQAESGDDFAIPFVSEQFLFWCAGAVCVYSLVVPLLATESLYLAQLTSQFWLLQQSAILIIVTLMFLRLFGDVVRQDLTIKCVLPAISIFLLLASIQSTSETTTLLAAISGMIPWRQVRTPDIAFHAFPIVGSALVLMETMSAVEKPHRRSKPVVSSSKNFRRSQRIETGRRQRSRC